MEVPIALLTICDKNRMGNCDWWIPLTKAINEEVWFFFVIALQRCLTSSLFTGDLKCLIIDVILP